MQNSTSHIGLPFAAEHFTDPAAAVERVREIYDANTAYLRDCFKRFSAGEDIQQRVHACYPFVRVHTEIGTRVDTRLSYGFVAGPGTYATTVTRPDLFSHYFLEQFELLRRNHNVVLEVGVSRQPIPIHFAFPEGLHVEGDLSPERLCGAARQLRPARPVADGRQHRQRHASCQRRTSRRRWRCSPARAWTIRSTG